MAIKSSFARSLRAGFKQQEVGKKENKGNVIIQCPKCQTKFSVSSELISELELPRFHCSRCDNVFDMDPRTSANFEDSDINQASEQPNHDPNDDTRNDYEDLPSVPEIPQYNADIDKDTMEFDASKNASTMEINREDLKKLNSSLDIPFERPSDKKEAAKPGEPNFQSRELNFTIPATPKSLEIPKTYSPAKPVSAPIENINDEIANLYKPEDPKVEQLSMNLKTDSLASKKEDESMPYGITFGDPLSNDPVGEEENLLPPSFMPQPAPRPSVLRSSWAGLTIFFMPIALTLACACVLSIMLMKTPNLAEALAGNIGISLPKFAPPGLYIENVKFNKIALDNGENIYTISGKVKNTSTEKFKTIILEGFAFDRAGQILNSTQANAGSGLSETRIRSLNAEMIKTMQASKASKKFELVPNADQSFLLVLDNANNKGDLNDAEFFSARIYSVLN